MVGEGLRQRLVRAVGLGDDHDAAGVLVEAVDDARPLDAADAGKAGAAMVDQRVDQRAGPVAGAGMDDEAGRLVDDDQVVVLVEDVERDRLALRLGRLRLRQVDRHAVAGRELALRLRRPACRRRCTAPCRISACTRLRDKSRAERCRQPLVEPLAGAPPAPPSALSIRLALRYQGRSSTLDPEIYHGHGLRRRRRGKAARPGGREACAGSWSASSRSISACCSSPLWRWSARLSTRPRNGGPRRCRRRHPGPAAALSGEIALPAGARMVGRSRCRATFSIDAELADGSRVDLSSTTSPSDASSAATR